MLGSHSFKSLSTSWSIPLYIALSFIALTIVRTLVTYLIYYVAKSELLIVWLLFYTINIIKIKSDKHRIVKYFGGKNVWRKGCFARIGEKNFGEC